MNQLSTIKERLRNFNDTEFQELCDCFLSLRNKGYKAYSRTGAHDIKQKTIRGTPDSFIQISNGLYLFIECTTTEHKEKRLINKLKSDISGCLNVDATKIPINKIEEIILCYNSNLKVNEIEEVNERAMEMWGKPPIHYSLDALATEILFHHKNLAHDYLGLPLDTGQVVLLDKFVEEYDNGKQKMATPLAGIFLHRTTELEVISKKIANGDIIIISGPAGVGKSKLAVKSIKQFIESNLDYNAYAISPKGADLLGDLGAYFEGEDNSILLVDDVNRVDKFEQILGFYKGLKNGKLKLVLTVRDYALQVVREWLSVYENSIVEIGGFSHEEIKALISKKPYEVRNGIYQSKICSIAKGNARLAVMLAMIARNTNKLQSLTNVADLFEQYFETFITDEGTFKDKRVLKALGILSFFYTIPYNDDKLLISLAQSFSISIDELREAFDKLHDLDLIELNYQHVRFGEQNLSTYFFYKIFIKDQLLSFKSLWDNYFEKQEHRFKDTLYPIYQNFGKEYVTKEIKPVLLSYWATIQSDESKTFRFLNFAWEFLPDECIAYIESRIEEYITSKVTELKITYDINEFASTNKQEKHLHLLAKYLKTLNYCIDALELSFQFIKKNPQHLHQLIYHIDQNFTFIDEDYINHFERQANLVDYLVEEAKKGKLQALSFFAVSNTLLKRLRWTYKNKNESKIDDPNIASVKQSRGKVLSALCNLSSNYPEDVFEVLLNLSVPIEKDNKYTFEFDLFYIIPWINSNMDCTNFRHSYYVLELIRSSIKAKYDNDEFKRLKSIFTHPTYSLFELVNWNRRRSKEDYECKDFEELKKADLTKNLTFKSKDEIKQFISRYYEILEWNKIQIYSQNQVIDVIIKANLITDNEIGLITFVELATLKDKIGYTSDFFISNSSMDSLTIYPKLAERFWESINVERLKENWKLQLLASLPVASITNEHLCRLFNALNEIKINFSIEHERLRKYEIVAPNILSKVLDIVVRKIEEDKLNISLNEDFFVIICDLNYDLNEIKKAYLQQDLLNHFFDSRGGALMAILKRDSYFLLEYIKVIFKNDQQEHAKDHKELTIIWKFSNAEELLDEAIKYMANIVDHYFFSEHFANAFFHQLSDSGERADKYLLKFIEKYSDKPKMIHIAFDIIRNSRKDLFIEAFKKYINNNQKIEFFTEIEWTENQVVYAGNAIVGAIRAARWEKLLSIVESEKLGIKTREIRNYIKHQRDSELRYAEDEKRRKFFNGSKE